MLLLLLQLNLKASDPGGRFDTADLIVTISRDELKPFFIGAPYSFSFDDSRQPGAIVFNEIIARDLDGTVRVSELDGTICLYRLQHLNNKRVF